MPCSAAAACMAVVAAVAAMAPLQLADHSENLPWLKGIHCIPTGGGGIIYYS